VAGFTKPIARPVSKLKNALGFCVSFHLSSTLTFHLGSLDLAFPFSFLLSLFSFLPSFVAQKKQNASAAKTRSVVPRFPPLHESELPSVKQLIRAIVPVTGHQDERLFKAALKTKIFQYQLGIVLYPAQRTLLRKEPLPGQLCGEKFFVSRR